MQQLKFLNSREVKAIMAQLESQFGFTDKIDAAFLKNEKDKVFLLTKDVANIDAKKLRIDRAGLYIGEIRPDGIRLSIEGSQLIAAKAKKNVLEVTDSEASQWLRGETISSKAEGYQIIKHHKDILGCGKAVEGKVLNYVPKERRILVS